MVVSNYVRNVTVGSCEAFRVVIGADTVHSAESFFASMNIQLYRAYDIIMSK